MICEKKTFNCKYCCKTFSRETNMYRHMRNNCRVKKEEDGKRKDIYQRLLNLEEKCHLLENNNNNLRKKVVMFEQNINNTVNIDNSVNNVSNTNNINKGTINNIVLVGYGNEDMKKIPTNDIIKAIESGFLSAIKLTETIHFNPRFPEYHNIYISNMKDKYAMKYDGKDWSLIVKEELIDKIYEDKKNFIEENFDDFINSLSGPKKNALERWLKTDDDDEKVKRVKQQIKLLLYNKRTMVANRLQKHQ